MSARTSDSVFRFPSNPGGICTGGLEFDLELGSWKDSKGEAFVWLYMRTRRHEKWSLHTLGLQEGT